MTKTFSIAIVGAGIGEQQARGLALLQDRFRISVICDRDTARAAKLAELVAAGGGGLPAVVGDYGDELLKRSDVDIVSICLPPFLHYEAIQQALKAGRHVVCEKPLVGSLAEVDAIDTLAKSCGRILMPVFQYRFGNGLRKAKHLIEAGVAGKVYHTSIETHWARGPAYYAVPWRGKKKTELGGVFLGHAIHIHDMLTHLVGEVKSVSAMTTVRVNPIETEDCAGALFEMVDGSIAVSSATLGSADEFSKLRISCENLTMVSSLSPYQPDRDPWTFIPKSPEVEARIASALAAAPLAQEGYTEQFARFYDSLSRGVALPVSVGEARRSIEIASAIYHSAQTGERIHLPLGASHPVYNGW